MLAHKRLTSLFALGLFFGAATTFTLSRDAPNTRGADNQRNVVVLRGEKRVSLTNMKAPVEEILESLSLQTGYQFEAEPEFDLETGRYTALVQNLPLRDVLNATGELLGGRWDRTRDGYNLRPLSPKEVLEQTDLFEDLARRSGEIIREIDASEVSPDLRSGLAGMDHVMRQRPIGVPVFAPDALPLLQIFRSDESIAIGYVNSGPNGSFSHSRGLLRVHAGSIRTGMNGGRFEW